MQSLINALKRLIFRLEHSAVADAEAILAPLKKMHAKLLNTIQDSHEAADKLRADAQTLEAQAQAHVDNAGKAAVAALNLGKLIGG